MGNPAKPKFITNDVVYDIKRKQVFVYRHSNDAWLVNGEPDNFRFATEEEKNYFYLSDEEERIIECI